ncbi:MAG: hypothetical protein KC496_02500, partial [Anaerolineae bacterium]|nr:hypothetical protein [Anaerolineae bacterium]
TWIPGEGYYDSTERITINVIEQLSGGFIVNVGNNIVPPANNKITTPTTASAASYTHTMNTILTTVDPNDPALSCLGDQAYYSVWYRYTAPQSGVLTVDTNTSNFDTVLAMFTGSSSSLNEVACNNDAAGLGTRSKIQYGVVQGTAYYIMVGGPNYDDYGSLVINFGYDGGNVPNDDINDAIVITTPEYTNTQSTDGATRATDDPNMGCYIDNKHEHSVWYRYTAPEAGYLSISTLGSDYDTVLGVFTGRRGALTSVGCDDDGQGTQSILYLDVQRGVTYYIEVAGFSQGDTGTMEIELDFDPFNDDFDNAFEITRMTRYFQFTEGAETVASDPEFTCVGGQRNHSVWYKYTPTRTGYLTVNTNGSDFDTVLAIWTGTRSNLTNVACNDDGGTGTQSMLQDVVVYEGVTYYIEVAGYWDYSYGRLYLTTAFTPPLAPAQVALLSPRNNTYTNDTTPMLEWREALRGYEYRVEVATDPRFTNIVYDNVVAALSDTTTTLPEGMYYWHVQAISELGVNGAWSGVWRFIVDTTPPDAPILRLPENGTSTTNNRPRFLWFPVAGAVAYDMQLDVVNPPATTVLDGGRNVYLPPTGLLVGTTYYWRARAIDAAGNVSAWSDTWSIFFDSPANAVPIRNRYTDNTPTLTWNRVSWATEYELQIDDAANFRSLEYT